MPRPPCRLVAQQPEVAGTGMALDPADTASSSRRTTSRSAVAFASTTAACAIGGWLGGRPEIAPLPASTLFPAAGIGLASVLVYGRRMLPALGLGAFLAVLTGLLPAAA